ncbi:hypothetical protein [Streptomyces fradiae]|uniref:hypothetical protein n=1 Tax=Streptomyces fradiae TaxID=1906 RepID=UPI0036514913
MRRFLPFARSYSRRARPPVPQCTALSAVLSRWGEVGYPMCELGEEHGGEHAQFCRDDDASGGAVWFRWGGLGGWLVRLPWCGVAGGADGDACMLFRGHPGAHSWHVTDPTMEAVRLDLERRFPELRRGSVVEPGREGRPGRRGRRWATRRAGSR